MNDTANKITYIRYKNVTIFFGIYIIFLAYLLLV